MDSSASIQPGANLQQSLTESKQQLVKDVWLGAAVLAAVDAPIAIWRACDVGMSSQLLTHMVLFVLIICAVSLRNTMRYQVLAPLLIGGTFIAGIAGAFSLGMTGAGYFWIAFSVLLVSLLYSFRTSAIAATIAALTTMIAGYCFASGTLTPAVDLNAHASSVSGWVNFLAVITIVPFVMLFAVHRFRNQLEVLYTMLEEQKAQLEILASYDQLTGLPVMRLADDRFRKAQIAATRAEDKLAVMFIDLDGFKIVNDTFGHDAGDLVLQEVAERLKKSVRVSDTVARIGGDEFMIILSYSSTMNLADIAKALIDRIKQPVQVRDTLVEIGASVGIALAEPEAEIKGLRAKADSAMYKAKSGGRNQFCFAEH